MMLMLLQQLLGVVTIAEARQNIIDIATGLGFNATSWQEGSWQRTFIEIFAVVYSTLTFGVSQIASGGYNDLAEGTWLHLLADSHYDNQVHLAVTTQGTVILTSAQFAPPHTIAVDDLVASTESDITFRNKTAGTLSPGGTLSLTFEAEVAGAGGNVAPGSIVILKTALAGVTLSNPVIPATTSWITRDGADAETNEQLRTRNRSKWATLGIGPGMAYVHNSRQAHESVKRVFVDDTNPNGPGSLDVYLAGDSGPVSQTIVDVVEDYLTGVTDGVDRVNTTAILRVFSATAYPVTLAAAVYILKQYDTPENRALIVKSAEDYFKALPIGGQPLQDGGPGAVRLSKLGGDIIRSITGVQNVAFNALVDIPIPSKQVAVPTIVLTYYQV
jgi:hypothetical protein